jgi:adenylosuccinate synthase
VRQAINLSSAKEVALTKLDVLDKLEKIKICVAYKIDDKIYDYLPQANHLWDRIEPIYEEMTGWQESTVGLKSISDLPINAANYVKKIEDLCGVKAVIVSTGPKREETIIVK